MTSSLARPIARSSASSRFSSLARRKRITGDDAVKNLTGMPLSHASIARGDRHVRLAASNVAVEHEWIGYNVLDSPMRDE